MSLTKLLAHLSFTNIKYKVYLNLTYRFYLKLKIFYLSKTNKNCKIFVL